MECREGPSVESWAFTIIRGQGGGENQPNGREERPGEWKGLERKGIWRKQQNSLKNEGVICEVKCCCKERTKGNGASDRAMWMRGVDPGFVGSKVDIIWDCFSERESSLDIGPWKACANEDLWRTSFINLKVAAALVTVTDKVWNTFSGVVERAH